MDKTRCTFDNVVLKPCLHPHVALLTGGGFYCQYEGCPSGKTATRAISFDVVRDLAIETLEESGGKFPESIKDLRHIPEALVRVVMRSKAVKAVVAEMGIPSDELYSRIERVLQNVFPVDPTIAAKRSSSDETSLHSTAASSDEGSN